ncbi:putative signal peptide protein [Puccinia sorghi]|uniref:Putative signal peptide protein n=1 Tax=Puccinia sorghi TaxID=27349 RepID=A0A0L6VS94_9BASI|nr:putative signal peptide protein [Puccinia sorghi]
MIEKLFRMTPMMMVVFCCIFCYFCLEMIINYFLQSRLTASPPVLHRANAIQTNRKSSSVTQGQSSHQGMCSSVTQHSSLQDLFQVISFTEGEHNQISLEIVLVGGELMAMPCVFQKPWTIFQIFFVCLMNLHGLCHHNIATVSAINISPPLEPFSKPAVAPVWPCHPLLLVTMIPPSQAVDHGSKLWDPVPNMTLVPPQFCLSLANQQRPLGEADRVITTKALFSPRQMLTSFTQKYEKSQKTPRSFSVYLKMMTPSRCDITDLGKSELKSSFEDRLSKYICVTDGVCRKNQKITGRERRFARVTCVWISLIPLSLAHWSTVTGPSHMCLHNLISPSVPAWIDRASCRCPAENILASIETRVMPREQSHHSRAHPASRDVVGYLQVFNERLRAFGHNIHPTSQLHLRYLTNKTRVIYHRCASASTSIHSIHSFFYSVASSISSRSPVTC